MSKRIIYALLLDDNFKEFDAVLSSQQGKPFYVPKKTQFLKYADDFYFEEMPYNTAMLDFLAKNFKLNDEKCSILFYCILLSEQKISGAVVNMPERLTELGYELKSQKALEDFMEIYNDFHNNTRLWCNRGHTPEELFRMMPQKDRVPKEVSLGPVITAALLDGSINADDLRKSIMAAELPNEELRRIMLSEIERITQNKAKPERVRVGRNAPCPCVSGKKYKRCCGK